MTADTEARARELGASEEAIIRARRSEIVYRAMVDGKFTGLITLAGQMANDVVDALAPEFTRIAAESTAAERERCAKVVLLKLSDELGPEIASAIRAGKE